MDWLGTNLIASACGFEVAAAHLIASEAGIIDELIRSGASMCELLHANQTVCCVVLNLRFLEEAIVTKIHKGVNLPPVPELPKDGECAYGMPCFGGGLRPSPERPPCRDGKHASSMCAARDPQTAGDECGCAGSPARKVWRSAGRVPPSPQTRREPKTGGDEDKAAHPEGEREP